MLKLSIITLFLGQTKNRFLVYQDPADTPTHLDRAGAAEGIGAVELRYPADTADIPATKEALKRNNLAVSAINFASVRNDRWLRGAWTAEDPADRQAAVDDAKRAMDLAAELGASRLHNCPLNEGFDYPFELDPIAALDYSAECFEKICAHNRDINVCIEYKINEPRVRCQIGSAGELIAFADIVGARNLGATLDAGHCFLAGENPAATAALLHKCNRLFYVHINDNDTRGDWDVLPGTWHTWEFVELFYTLERLGYDDWIAFDIVCKEHDATPVFTDAAAIANKLKELSTRIDKDDMAARYKRRHPTSTMRMLNDLL
ncbi:sugar phosphate isomerase/epimerase family protein [Tropicimonas sediminicola]|uniref:Xylose isomerase n=1 Tax=Tropicimonas sediminicola TaxID=1031541 RepID=A0A239LMR7_9RHOB|nr:sugar phosphate isomerase/epimerase family protein [Tropicimonas sediminicola]SNT31192.1 xylose isomerase [Tropicimonas sediminicola]